MKESSFSNYDSFDGCRYAAPSTMHDHATRLLSVANSISKGRTFDLLCYLLFTLRDGKQIGKLIQEKVNGLFHLCLMVNCR